MFCACDNTAVQDILYMSDILNAVLTLVCVHNTQTVVTIINWHLYFNSPIANTVELHVVALS